MAKIFGKAEGDVLQAKPIYAADADTVILLSKIAFGDIGKLEKEYRAKPQLLKDLKSLWKNVYYGQIELVITPSVMAELGVSEIAKNQYSESMLKREYGEVPLMLAKFVRHFCTPLLEPQNKEFEQRVAQLAEEYCLYAGFNYLYENGVVKPCKDAFNLAQAVAFGLPILTGNSSDYIDDVVGRNGSVIHKLEKIREINTKYGYTNQSEQYPYNSLEPVSIWHLFPETIKMLPSEAFLDNFYTTALVKDITTEEVAEEYKEYFETNVTRLKVLEQSDYSKEVPQTMLVLIDVEKSTSTTVEPSFIAFAIKREKRDNPYIFEPLGADILYYKSEDADENGDIQIEDYYKSVIIPKDKFGHFRKSSAEYKEYERLLKIYKERYSTNEELNIDDGKQDNE